MYDYESSIHDVEKIWKKLQMGQKLVLKDIRWHIIKYFSENYSNGKVIVSIWHLVMYCI